MSLYRYNPLLRLGLDRISGSGIVPLIPATQVVADYASLPDPVVNDGLYYHVQNTTQSGVWPFRVTRDAGVYRATGGAWEYEGTDVNEYLSDDTLLFKDDVSGNGLGYTLDNLTANRKAIWQDKDGTVAYLSDLTTIINVTGTYTLPDASTYNGSVIRLVNRSGASHTVDTTGADTIEGESSQLIYDRETFDLTPVGTNWVL